MAELFSGTQLPAWLAERAERTAERGAWGQIAGTLGAGLINSLQRDENAPVNPETGEQPRKGFAQGLWEARMNQRDPLWKLKTETAKTAVLSEMAQAESAHALALERQQELRAWMQDAPAISGWAAMTPDDRSKAVAPTAESLRGAQMIQTLGIADQNYLLKRDNTKRMLEHEQRNSDWETLYGTMPEGLQTFALANGGMFATDPSTNIKHPNPLVVNRYNAWALTTDDRVPFGIGKAEQAALLTQRKAKAASDLQKERLQSQEVQNEARINAQANRPRSKLGGMIYDLDTAETNGASEATLSLLRKAIEQETATEADGGFKTEVLANGQTAIWKPGSKKWVVLKDPKREGQAKAALAEYNSALIELRNLEGKKAEGYNVDQQLLNTVASRRNAAQRKLESALDYGQQVPKKTSPATVQDEFLSTDSPPAAVAPNQDPLGLFK